MYQLCGAEMQEAMSKLYANEVQGRFHNIDNWNRH